MGKPIGRLIDSHSEDITSVVCHNGLMISSGVDNLLCMFNLPQRLTTGKNSGKFARVVEEDFIDGCYSSAQAIIDSGFYSNDIFWV
jgi:hypothetical protein